MTNKYYQPQIEEFKVGFRYEVLRKGRPPQEGWMYMDAPNTEDEWFKFSWPDPYVGYDLKKLFDSSDQIRVKHLDQQDIEDSNFEVNAEFDWLYKKGDFTLKLLADDNTVIIFDKDDNTLFDGSIKNRSELKVLLTQLGIE